MALLMLTPANAPAFSIGSAISDFCHEKITHNAYRRAIFDDLENVGFTFPDDAAFASLATYLAEQVHADYNNDAQRMVLMSLFVGVRYPDQEGFAIYDLSALRSIHLGEIGQEDHCLRGVDMDGEGADAAALAKARELILSLADEGRQIFEDNNRRGKLVKVPFWLEHYGSRLIDVWEPGFLLGRAAHTLQDSFPHTYRSDDAMQVYAVANFVEGLGDDHDLDRDGPRHSNLLDQCNDARITPLAEIAEQATLQLMVAMQRYWGGGQRSGVEDVLERFMSHQPGCDSSNDFCNSHWAKLGRTDETEPPLSCSHGGATVWAFLFCLLALRPRQRRVV